jgi:anti-sigma regulatory factor (Ser/Thr protein kinase)
MIGGTSKDREETAPPPPLELELERNVEAPAIARAAVSELSQHLHLSGSTSQTLVLLVSEVVSNAVLHSSGPKSEPITLMASATPDAVRITVTDSGGGFVPRQRDPTSIHDGYGLYLVDKAASRWGVDETAPTSVWFELSR